MRRAGGAGATADIRGPGTEKSVSDRGMAELIGGDRCWGTGANIWALQPGYGATAIYNLALPTLGFDRSPGMQRGEGAEGVCTGVCGGV